MMQKLADFLSGLVSEKTVLAAIVCCLSSTSVVADTSVWEVSNGSNTVYLGGTVHLLRPADYPLPEAFDEAYNNSDELYFETDLSAMGDLTTQTQMLQQLTYTDDRTLQSVLNDEAYSALQDYASEVGMPIGLMQKFKPGMVISTLQVLEFQSMGFTPQGVDAHFNTRAINDGKAVNALETIQEQIGFLAAMGEGNESEFILVSLEDLEETGTVMEQIINAWRSGDAEQLAALFVDDMREQAPDIYESLLNGRNQNWLPVVETMFDDADTEFVLVGAAHLVGADGLVSLLLDLGYEVRQL